MDADYADDIVFFANTPTQAESLLHSLEQAAGGNGLHMNADKMECMFLNQKGDSKWWLFDFIWQVHVPC